MVTMKITNNDPIGLYMTRIYTEGRTTDKALIDIIENTNKAIKHFESLPANAENCQRLQVYFKHYQALLAGRPDSDVKTEANTQLTNLIDTLQTGIDRVPTYSSSTSRSNKSSEPSWATRVRQAIQRWEIWRWRERPIKTDINTLEGYIRSLPRIEQMDIYYLFDHYIDRDVICKYWYSHMKEDPEKLVKRVEADVIQTYAFVKLTLTKPTYTVIENQYPEAEELYSFVIEQGASEPVEPATAQSR